MPAAVTWNTPFSVVVIVAGTGSSLRQGMTSENVSVTFFSWNVTVTGLAAAVPDMMASSTLTKATSGVFDLMRCLLRSNRMRRDGG